MSTTERITRRRFLKMVVATTAAILPTGCSNSHQEVSPLETDQQQEASPYSSKTETQNHFLEWQETGPNIIIKENEASDGNRACVISSEGQKVLGTWNHGTWIEEDGLWTEIDLSPENSQEKENIIARHIITIPPNSEEYKKGYRFLITSDKYLHLLKKTTENIWETKTIPFENSLLAFGQCVEFVKNDNKLEILAGGNNGVIKVSNWAETSMEIEINPIFNTKSFFSQKEYIIRTIITNPRNPKEIYIGGWNYDNSNTDTLGKIPAGMGVFKSIDGGETWNLLKATENLNINCLWIHPNNPQTIVLGTEGAGNKATRKPDSEYPSLKISFDGGESWIDFNPKPWTYDLVTPSQAFAYYEDYLFISFFGGPVYKVKVPKNLESLESIKWELLTPPGKYSNCGGQISIGGGKLLEGGKNYIENPPYTMALETKL